MLKDLKSDYLQEQPAAQLVKVHQIVLIIYPRINPHKRRLVSCFFLMQSVDEALMSSAASVLS